MEELYAELLLWYTGFRTSERYNALLDEKFLSSPDNELYLELERVSFNLLDSMGRFERYWNDECSELNWNSFGKRLFSSLKIIYDKEIFELADFGKRCNKLGHILPDSVAWAEPFFTLIYADEPLAWEDELQTRELYEKAFAFYG